MAVTSDISGKVVDHLLKLSISHACCKHTFQDYVLRFRVMHLDGEREEHF